MSDSTTLNALIDNYKKPNVNEWIFDVEGFLNRTNNNTSESREYIRHIKQFGDNFEYCENMLAFLKQIRKNKNDTIILPEITKRNQIFVAMKFCNDTKDRYENGYKKVIQGLNYSAMRIDEKEYTGSIIDEIVKEIHNSVVLIADLTGNRGGVYYEAGIAKGLELCNHPIKLVLTCQKDFFDNEKVHFDVQGDNIVLYHDTSDLVTKLSNRLNAVLKGDTNDQT